MKLKLIIVLGLLGAIVEFSEEKRVARAFNGPDTALALSTITVSALVLAFPLFAPVGALILAVMAFIVQIVKPADDTPEKLDGLLKAAKELHDDHNKMTKAFHDQLERAVSLIKYELHQTVVREFASDAIAVLETYSSYLRCFADKQLTNCTDATRDDLATYLIGQKFHNDLRHLRYYATPNPIISTSNIFEIIEEQHQLMIKEGLDCNTGKSYQQLLASVYIYVVIALLQGYSMKLGALLFANRATINDSSAADRWRRERDIYVSECADHVRAITRVGEVFIKRAPRDIRSCDGSPWVFGTNYVHLNQYKRYMLSSPPYEMTSVFGVECKGTLELCEHHLERRVAFYHEPSHRLWSIVDHWDNHHYGRLGHNSSMTRFDLEISVFPSAWSLCICRARKDASPETIDHFCAFKGKGRFPRIVISAKFHHTEGAICLITCTVVINVVTHEIINKTLSCDEPRRKYDNGFTWIYVGDITEIQLNDIEAPPLSWIIGIGLESKNRRLLISIKYEGINRLLNGKNDYEPKEATRYNGSAQRINLYEPDWPLAAQTENVLRSKPGDHYIVMEITHGIRDLGQTVLPYFDTQNPIPDGIWRPISGVGLYYKNPNRCRQDSLQCLNYDFGGFVGIKLITAEVTAIFTPALLNISNIILESLKSDNFSENPLLNALP